MVVPAPQHGIQFVTTDSPVGVQVRGRIEAFLIEHLRVPPPATPTPK
jgi:hypothetical protein